MKIKFVVSPVIEDWGKNLKGNWFIDTFKDFFIVVLALIAIFIGLVCGILIGVLALIANEFKHWLGEP